MKPASSGDKVRVHYRGTFDDGTEFDTSADREPIELTIGQGEVISGFEEALVGMSEGDTKNVTVPADDAYGQKHPELVQVISRERIPAEIELKVGTVLQASDGSGTPIRVQVIEFNDHEVTLDANHPLAGKALNFELRLVEVVD